METIKTLLLVLAMLLADLAHAEIWTPTTSTNAMWKSVASSADGTRLFAAGELYNYYVSTNSGSTWIAETDPQAGGYYGSWVHIAASADGTTIAAVNSNVIWVSTNSGTTWFTNLVPGATFFDSVVLSADGTKLMVGDGYETPGGIYTSTNSGVTMLPTTAPTNHWSPLASSADGTKLFAGVEASPGGPIYASTNSGLTWLPTGAPTNNSWAGIAASADGSKLVAASGLAYNPTTFGAVYTSTNFGMNWTSNNVPNVQWESVASSADGTKLVAVSAGGLICSSTNSGAAWQIDVATNYLWTGVASSADGNLKVVVPVGPAPIYLSQTTPSPQLNLTPSSTNLMLSWTIPSTNFVLQQSSDLISWADATNPPVPDLTNLSDQVTLPSSNSSGFFRLKTP